MFKFKTEPFKHQADLLEFHYNKPYGAVCWDMATGKSKFGIDWVSNLFFEGKIDIVIVIAPNNIQAQWHMEQIPAHCSVPYESMLWRNSGSSAWEKAMDRFLYEDSSKLRFLCVNIERFSTVNSKLDVFADILRNNKTAIIIDESTRIKNPDANRTKTLVAMGKLAKVKMIMTGTFITENPFGAYSQIEFLCPGYWGMNYFMFKNRYGIQLRDLNRATGRAFNRLVTEKDLNLIRDKLKKGMSPEEISDVMYISVANIEYIRDRPNLLKPYKHLDEIKTKIKDFTSYVRKEECIDLPPKIYEVIRVDMSKEQTRVYNDLKRSMLAEYAGKELTVTHKMTLLLRLQQVAGGFFPYEEELENPHTGNTFTVKRNALIGVKNEKAEIIASEMEELDGKPMLIFCRFVAEITYLRDFLTKRFPEKRIETYFGGDSKEKRIKNKVDFQQDLIDCLIMNPQTGAFGLNLQNCSYTYYFSNTQSLEYRNQSEERTNRPGQKNNPVYKDIICRDTVDELVYNSLKNKKDLYEYFRTSKIEEFLQ